jgi:cysteine desulfurase family protein (TIGR01976 family)
MTTMIDTAAADVASVEDIRAQFPALERTHNGFPVAYLDGPGGTQVPRGVVHAMEDYLFNHNANTHWRYPTSEETDALIAHAREALASFINGRADEIVFGQNMTSLTFHLARAFGGQWGRGDEVVLTELDHHGNVAPWTALQQDVGVNVRMVKMRTEDGRLDWNDLEAAITPRTKLLAINAASNALGTITDIARATALAQSVGAKVFVDAVHYAPTCSSTCRPSAAISSDAQRTSSMVRTSASCGETRSDRSLDAPRLAPAPQESPERLETGTQNHEGIVGAAAAVDFLASLANGDSGPPRRIACVVQRSARAAAPLQAMELVVIIDGLTLYGPKPGTPRTPTLSFTLRGFSTDDVADALAERGVFVSNGDFYAATIVERLGLVPGGLVRVGCSCYTSDAEVDRLIDGVRALARERA